jgi:hypothetical protein
MSNSQTIPADIETGLIQYAKGRMLAKSIKGVDLNSDAVVKIVNPNSKPDDIRYEVSWFTANNERFSVDCIIKHPHCMSFMDMGIYVSGGSYGLKKIA